jgi:peptidoglycan hydrolase FlgJ
MAVNSSPDLSAKFALDTQALGGLKQSAKTSSPDAMRGAATQFEAMFINQMLKSMRDASPQDGPMDSEQTKMFTGMLDQQMSQTLAKRGLGLADMLVRQMTQQQVNQQALALGGATDGALRTPDMTTSTLDAAAAMAKTQDSAAAASSGRSHPAHVQKFKDKLADQAAAAEKATGIPAKFMLGQAALESGWGKREIKMADGSASHNLFGIKAGPGWKGKVATAVTTEYINGKPHTKVEKFRAYDSYAEGFKDYASMLANNPRYQPVLDHGGDAVAFARGLQKAGYATDPHYAAKVASIIKHSLA